MNRNWIKIKNGYLTCFKDLRIGVLSTLFNCRKVNLKWNVSFTGKILARSFWNLVGNAFIARLNRSSRIEVFCKRGVLTNFEKLTRKHQCESLLLNKVAGLCEISKNTFSYRIPLADAFDWRWGEETIGHVTRI